MKFLKIVKFELAYQLRTVSTWLCFIVLTAVSFLFITGNYIHDAREGNFFVNAPIVIAAVTVFGCLLWLLVAAAVAGDAATRDLQTRMHTLTYAAPVSKAEYLGGRFLAAFIINAMILLGLPAGTLVAIYLNDVEAEIIGPFNAAVYLGTYGFLTLPNAFVGTALQFSLSTLKGKAMASYLAGAVLFFAAYILGSLLNRSIGQADLGSLVDPLAFSSILNQLSNELSPIEKNTHLVWLDSSLIWNRLLWMGIALAGLLYCYMRFKKVPRQVDSRKNSKKERSRSMQAGKQDPGTPFFAIARINNIFPLSGQKHSRSVTATTRIFQTYTIAWTSFKMLAKNRAGLIVLALISLITLVVVPLRMQIMGVPLLPRLQHVITFLTAPLSDSHTPWIILPLLILYYVGELVWREREARMSEITATAPVSNAVLLLGKFIGLTLLLLTWLAMLTGAAVLIQLIMGTTSRLEIGAYARILFGFQLIDYLLFAVLAFLIHVLANQKYIAHLAALIVYGGITFAPDLGIDSKLLVYGAAPGWLYSDMRGFEPTWWPWIWFKLYWLAWAGLFALAVQLFWVRSREQGLAYRLQLARRRFTRTTYLSAVIGILSVVSLGSFIFYNTHILNNETSAMPSISQRAEYEIEYRKFAGIPQPKLVAVNLQVEIYPGKGAAHIKCTYSLVNESTVPIDSIHLVTARGVETSAIGFDRSAVPVLQDHRFRHLVYKFIDPLLPGDSIKLSFDVKIRQNGFSNNGNDALVVSNGTYFRNQECLPSIGYESLRELTSATDRKQYGLPARPEYPLLYKVSAHTNAARGLISFNAVVGTSADQVAVAPGSLRREWTKNGRRYFHYATNAPIQNRYAFFSARYSIHKTSWQPADSAGQHVSIEIFHHPAHSANVERMAKSASASLSYYSKVFGAYPYKVLRLVEHPGPGLGMHAEPGTVDFEEGFTLINPKEKDQELDLPFYVVAHEVAHQWWGAAQLAPARVEGAGILSESLATFSAMQVLEHTHGDGQLQSYLAEVRKTYEIPRTRAAQPLLRATDAFHNYRKGPFALYALSRYVGQEAINHALRRLLEAHRSGRPPLPTSLDLYRELKGVTPDSLQYLLHDLFEVNCFWELKTDQVSAKEIHTGKWTVTLHVQARKIVVDSLGIETEVPMNDLVEIGVFDAGIDNKPGKPLYLELQRLRSGKQQITLTIGRKPVSVGVDPNHLLIDLKMGDNFRKVKN